MMKFAQGFSCCRLSSLLGLNFEAPRVFAVNSSRNVPDVSSLASCRRREYCPGLTANFSWFITTLLSCPSAQHFRNMSRAKRHLRTLSSSNIPITRSDVPYVIKFAPQVSCASFSMIIAMSTISARFSLRGSEKAHAFRTLL